MKSARVWCIAYCSDIQISTGCLINRHVIWKTLYSALVIKYARYIYYNSWQQAFTIPFQLYQIHRIIHGRGCKTGLSNPRDKPVLHPRLCKILFLILILVSLILHPCAQTRKSSTVMWPDFPVFSCQIGKKTL